MILFIHLVYLNRYNKHESGFVRSESGAMQRAPQVISVMRATRNNLSFTFLTRLFSAHIRPLAERSEDGAMPKALYLTSRTRVITVKPGYNALEGTCPRERYRRESVIRGESVSGITKREIITIAAFNDDPRTKRYKMVA